MSAASVLPDSLAVLPPELNQGQEDSLLLVGLVLEQ